MGRRIQFNQDVFESINALEKAYWLGFIYADGCVQKYRLAFCQGIRDADTIEKLLKFLDHPRKPTPTRCGTKVQMFVYSKKLVSDLNALGVVPRKSLSLKFPSLLCNHFMKGFILGFLDGDGTVHIRKDNHLVIKFTSGSKKFLDDLNHFLNEEIFESKDRITRVTKDKRAWQLRYRSNRAKKLVYYLFDPELDGIFMDRKLGKALRYFSRVQ